MSEGDRRAYERLLAGLAALELRADDVLVVHSSLSSMGWVDGGADTVVRALLETLGDGGTLVMPAATPECAAPDGPIFELENTPTSMGAIAECFRNWPGTLRSEHPLESICARGLEAAAIVADHPLHYSEGPGGPWAKLHRRDALILLIGVGFNRCTALHYAESLSSKRRNMVTRVAVRVGDELQWRELRNVADDNDTHFPVVGARFLESKKLRSCRLGDAQASFFRMADLVDFATPYFDRHL